MPFKRHSSSRLLSSPLTVAVLAVLLVQAGVAAFDTGRYIQGVREPSAQAESRPLQPVSVEASWVKSGKPVFTTTETVRSPDGRTINGLWVCDGATTFEWTFALDETVHVLEGEVHIDYLGRQFTLKPGDTATFHHGTKALWRVPQHLKKAYTLHQPGRLVLVWRWLLNRT